jgi:hypothetical protein
MVDSFFLFLIGNITLLLLFYYYYYLNIIRVPILSCLGKPIPVVKTENPTNEQIEELLQKLQTGVQELFDKSKHAYGYGHQQLTIK